MNLKRLGTALAVVLAFAAMSAGSAFAAATFEVKPWRTGTSESKTTVLTGHQPVTASLSSTAVLETEVGTTPLKIQATGIECNSCSIFNEGGDAEGEGKLKLTGVTVVTPAACAVSGGSIQTEPTGTTWTWMVGELDFIEIEAPAASSLAQVTLAKGTGACPIAGTYALTGRLFTAAPWFTATYATSRPVESSKSINETAGGSLKFGSKAASLAATINFKAGGTFFGTE